MAHLTKADLNIYKIARTIGHATTDLGKLCTSVKVNRFSRYKPMYGNHDGRLTLAEMQNVNFGVYGKHYPSAQAMFSATDLSAVWDGPVAPYYRIKDWAAEEGTDQNYGYFHYAQNPFMQAMGTRYTIDVVQASPDPIIFYLLFNTSASYLYNRGFSTVSGIDRSVQNFVPSGDLPCNIAAEDIWFTSDELSAPQKLIDTTYPARLGIIIYRNISGSQTAEWFSTYDLTTQTSGWQINMYNIPTTGIWDTTQGGVPLGTYTAIACAKKTNDNGYYLPVFSVPAFPAKFILDVGGLSNYRYLRAGVRDINMDANTYVTSMSTTLADLYLKIVFFNRSGKSLLLILSKLVLSVTLSGENMEYQGVPITYQTRTVTATRESPSQTQVTIPDKGSSELIFKITNVWSPNGVNTNPALDQGTLKVLPTLTFNNQSPFQQQGSSVPEYVITYGSSL